MSEVQYIDGVYDEERRLIQEAARQNRLVLFVGAGASIPSGMPSWRNAVGEIKKRLNEYVYSQLAHMLRYPAFSI